MANQICKVVEQMLRAACFKARGRPCLNKEGLASVGLSGPSVPAAPVPHRTTCKLDFPSSRLGWPTLGHSSKNPSSQWTALMIRNQSTVALRGQSLIHPQLDIDEVLEEVYRAQSSKMVDPSRQYILDPNLAKIVAEHVVSDDPKALILECNPGPGMLTRSLLNAGSQRVVALEGSKSFLPGLQELEYRVDGQLQVVHCDFFRLDPIGCGPYKLPSMPTDKLFNDLGISQTSWTDDIRVKVVGMIPVKNQRGRLMKMIYAIYEQLSVYRYGRIELNFFMSEKLYRSLIEGPANWKRYSSLSVICQMACDIELLHKEPWNSFQKSSKWKANKEPLCLVRLRPKADLFSSGLTPSNASALLMMIRQCMAKRSNKLHSQLNLWSPDSGSELLLEMCMSEDIQTGNVLPEEYLKLFLLMEKSKDFEQSWLFKEFMENAEREGRS